MGLQQTPTNGGPREWVFGDPREGDRHFVMDDTGNRLLGWYDFNGQVWEWTADE